jgi:hypothetical protein
MPGDPKECRQRALNCILMAKALARPKQRITSISSHNPGSVSLST